MLDMGSQKFTNDRLFIVIIHAMSGPTSSPASAHMSRRRPPGPSNHIGGGTPEIDILEAEHNELSTG